MSVLPYGGNVIVNSISSSIQKGTYFLNRSDYITSQDEVSTMQFSYKEQDGAELIGIDTNLEIVEWTTTTNPKTFTLSNSNIFSTSTKPYINLQCNNVRSYISFINFDKLNKWQEFKRYPDLHRIRVSGLGRTFFTLIDSVIVNWDTTSKATIMIDGSELDSYSGTDIAIVAFYNYLENGKIKSESLNLWKTKEYLDVIGQEITIPKLNGTLSELRAENQVISKHFINYFALGYYFHIYSGYGRDNLATSYYISGSTNVYDERGWLREISGIHSLVHDKGIPVFYENDKIKESWNNDLFFATQEKIEDFNGNQVHYFISPSTSKIYHTLPEGTSCTNDYCECEEYVDQNPCEQCDSETCVAECTPDTCEQCPTNEECDPTVCNQGQNPTMIIREGAYYYNDNGRNQPDLESGAAGRWWGPYELEMVSVFNHPSGAYYKGGGVWFPEANVKEIITE